MHDQVEVDNARRFACARIRFLSGILFAVLLAFPSAAYADITATQEARLVHSYSYPPFMTPHFGSAVAKDGGTLAVGDGMMGIVSVFNGSGSSWTESAEVFGYSYTSGFGNAVGLSGGTLVTCGSLEGYQTWVLSGGTWVASPLPVSGMVLGPNGRVAIDGNVLVAGPIQDPSAGSVVEVFRNVGGTWTLVGEAPSSDGRAAVSGNEVAVVDLGGGVVRLCSVGASSVTEEQQIAYSDSGAWSVWDAGIDMDGNNLALGNSIDDKLTILHRTGGTWAVERSIVGTSSTYFGRSVAVKGDTIAVGAPNTYISDNSEGAVYLYQRGDGSWPMAGRVDSPKGYSIDNYSNFVAPGFGNSAALEGTELVIGADHELDQASAITGAVYLYSLAQPQANHAPIASALAAVTDAGHSVDVTLTATDADADPLTYSIVSGPAHGSLGAISGNRTTYTPAPGYSGADSFTFKANDGQADSNVATVSITVNAAPPPPTTSTPASSDWSLALLAVAGLAIVGSRVRKRRGVERA